MRAIAAGVTDVGKERDHNEDRFVLLPEFEVFVVADGMGGHQCGEVASRMATSTIASFFREHAQRAGSAKSRTAINGEIPDLLRASLLEANKRIHRRATTSSVHRGMGTTVVAAAFNRYEEKLHVAHAGDSRAYLLRAGNMQQLTRDHSLVEEALRTRPDITKSELAYLPANVITRALGVEPTVDIDTNVSDVRLGDLFLLCSDGLHGFVEDQRILEIIAGTEVLTSACAELIAEANNNGGGDNITAVLVRIEERDEPWAHSTSVPPAPGAGEAEPASVDRRALESTRVPVTAGLTNDSARALEADDTARLTPIGDPDAILASIGGSSLTDDVAPESSGALGDADTDPGAHD